METNGFHGHENSASSDLDESSFLETSSTTTTAATLTPIPSTRRYSVAGVVRSLFHAVLVQNTEHLDHVLTSLSLDPNKIRDREGKTMLMVAGTENKHRVLRYLLALPSIDVDIQDDEGETALYQAAAAGSTECVQLLLHAGASATLGNEESITPLIIASYNGFVSICRLLIAIGHADVNQQDNTLKSALLLASYAGHVDVMVELIEHGALLNTLDQYGWSSLMLAAYAGKLEACKLLLAHGADPHIRTTNGKNARSLSWDAGHKAIASYISKFLARDINMSTSSSGTVSGTGSGSGISSMTLIQQILPAVPKSPSRRTHSPAPSLPSVPEETQEEDHYRPRRSFSAHNSTVSRQSGLSSRLASAPKGRRPRSINVAPVQPKLSLDEPVSPLPSVIDTTMPPALSAPRSDSSSSLANVVAAASPAIERPVPARPSPVAPVTDAPVAHATSCEEPKGALPKIQAGSTPPTQIYTVHRSGIIPRYGAAQIDYQLEIHPHATSSIVTPTNATSVTDVTLQGPPSKSRSEREKEHDMEKHLNRRIVRRRRFKERSRNYAWFAVSQCATICCPSRLFPRSWSKDRQQDWREKVALCVMIIMLSAALSFLAFGLALLTCRPRSVQSLRPADFKAHYGDPAINAGEKGGLCTIRGVVYDVKGLFLEGFHPSASGNNVTWAGLDAFLSANYGGDISSLFPPADLNPTCQLFGLADGFGQCSLARGNFNHCHTTPAPEGVMQRFTRGDIRIVYDWEDVRNGALGRRLFVYDGTVLDVTDYLAQNISNIASAEEKDTRAWISSLVGKDATIAIQRQHNHQSLSHCLQGAFKVGVLSGQTSGCLVSIVINTLALAILLLISLMRLVSALVYRWMFRRPSTHTEKGSLASGVDVENNNDSPVLVLVTCRATDPEQQIKATLNSIVLASRPGSSTLLLVVADEAPQRPPGGTSQGAQSCIRLMDQSATVASALDEKDIAGSSDVEQDVESLAVCNLQQADTIAEGVPAIYSGFYQVEARRVPYVLVSLPASHRHSSQKEEYGSWSKKRLVVRWLHRICFNEAVTAFEYSLFERTRAVLGHGPERFDMLLMAAVGSEYEEHSIFQMVTALRNNERIMGICANRRISNGLDTWLTRIQDYENHLALQFSTTFDSLIGAGDCLPSGVSLYRIKVTRQDCERGPEVNGTKHCVDGASCSVHLGDAVGHGSDEVEIKTGPQQDVDTGDNNGKVDSSLKHAGKESHQRFIPILIDPDVVSSFTALKTRTLHERSMLTNGTEDRFLTGLLCRAFPTRTVVYLPRAVCRSKATVHFSTYLRQQTRATIGRLHTSWEHLRSAQPRGIRSALVYLLVFMEWLSLVLSPLVIILAWAMAVLVAVGAVTGAGALFSLPTVLALAFALSVVVLQPLLGLLLGSQGPAANLAGLFLFLVTVPLRYALLPVYAFLHLDETEPWLASGVCDDGSERHMEAPRVDQDTDTDQMLQSNAASSAHGSRRLRYLAQWHSMHTLKTKREHPQNGM
ncbi:hypothetical protein EC968_006567 [Mortierella alpina]|nr:hypothetical protein EC968_006567 [Mortierella alpina]